MATSDSTPRTIEIPLTKGYTAIIDEQDADLALTKWYAADTTRVVYAARSAYKKQHRFLHQLILERKLGRPLIKGEKCDHENGNSLDNTRKNLRLCTQRQNVQNARPRNNKAGLKGVVYDKQHDKWRALIKVNGKRIYLGIFDSPEPAHEAYCKAAEKYFGEFARFK